MTRKTNASSSYVGCVFRDVDNIAPPPDDVALLLLLLLTSVGRSGGAGRKLTMLQLADLEWKKWMNGLVECGKGEADAKTYLSNCFLRRAPPFDRYSCPSDGSGCSNRVCCDLAWRCCPDCCIDCSWDDDWMIGFVCAVESVALTLRSNECSLRRCCSLLPMW